MVTMRISTGTVLGLLLMNKLLLSSWVLPSCGIYLSKICEDVDFRIKYGRQNVYFSYQHIDICASVPVISRQLFLFVFPAQYY